MIKSTPPQSATEENVMKALYQNRLSVKAVINNYCGVFTLSLNLHERTVDVIWSQFSNTSYIYLSLLAFTYFYFTLF